jgi:hypothetical protein
MVYGLIIYKVKKIMKYLITLTGKLVTNILLKGDMLTTYLLLQSNHLCSKVELLKW